MGLKSFVKKGVGLASGTSGLGTALGFAGAGAEFLGAKSLQNDAQSFSREIGKNKYQWAVGDLTKAGLNPILAVTGSGGLGGSPPGAGTSSARLNIPGATSSAVQMRRVKSEIRANESVEFRNRMQGEQAWAQSIVNANQANILGAQMHPLVRLAEIEANWYDSQLGTSAHQISLGMQAAGPVGGLLVGAKKALDFSKYGNRYGRGAFQKPYSKMSPAQRAKFKRDRGMRP